MNKNLKMKKCGAFLIGFLLVGCQGHYGHVHAPVIRSADTAPEIEFPGHPMHELVKNTDSASGVSLFEVSVPPRTSGPPPHIHKHEDEYFIILEGELRMLNGDEIITATPGTAATFTRGHQHTFWNNTDSPARYLLAIAPGDFGGFFDQVVLEIQASGAKDPQAIAAIIGKRAAARGVELLPQKIPAEQAALMGPKPDR